MISQGRGQSCLSQIRNGEKQFLCLVRRWCTYENLMQPHCCWGSSKYFQGPGCFRKGRGRQIDSQNWGRLMVEEGKALTQKAGVEIKLYAGRWWGRRSHCGGRRTTRAATHWWPSTRRALTPSTRPQLCPAATPLAWFPRCVAAPYFCSCCGLTLALMMSLHHHRCVAKRSCFAFLCDLAKAACHEQGSKGSGRPCFDIIGNNIGVIIG